MNVEVIVIGGGLAGMISALELARAGVEVMVIEKRNYPHHKVCGEYVSNEVKPYLESLGLDVFGLGATSVSRLAVSSPGGKMLEAPLSSGGFGISRYLLDQSLYRLCLEAGVGFLLDTAVSQVVRMEDGHRVLTSDGNFYESRFLIGAYGKRSGLDIKAERPFTRKSSPYMAVKYHIRYPQPADLISLHNFEGGYCGISAIEDGKSCLCYLTQRSNLKRSGGDLNRMQEEILGRNPHLKAIFSEAEFLYERPLVINEISFQKKDCVENGMLMAGDTAGLITPLCGNGMAMAVHSAKMLAGLISGYIDSQSDDIKELESKYRYEWNSAFGLRLTAGRLIQSAFGKEWVTDAALFILRNSGLLTRTLIGLTHGKDITRSGTGKTF